MLRPLIPWDLCRLFCANVVHQMITGRTFTSSNSYATHLYLPYTVCATCFDCDYDILILFYLPRPQHPHAVSPQARPISIPQEYQMPSHTMPQAHPIPHHTHGIPHTMGIPHHQMPPPSPMNRLPFMPYSAGLVYIVLLLFYVIAFACSLQPDHHVMYHPG